VFDCFLAQGDDAAFVSFPCECQVGWFGQRQGVNGERSDFTDACSAVVEQDEQHAIPPGLQVLPIEGGEDRGRLVLLKVFDGFAWCGRRLESLRSLVNRDQGDLLRGREVQEGFDGAQAKSDGCRLVVLRLPHPDQPVLEGLPVEVVEADVLTTNLLLRDQVVDVALQTDPVGVNAVRCQFPDLGQEVA